MMLKVGDIIHCKKALGDLTVGKGYQIIKSRNKESKLVGNDICIKDDSGYNLWFGQIGESECWTNWFVSLRIDRNKKLTELGI